ncbi:MAG: YdcF family protein [Limnothrix sp.]
MTALFIRVLLSLLFVGLLYWVLWKLIPRKLFTYVGGLVVLILIGLSFYNPTQVVSLPDPIWKIFIFPFKPLGIGLILFGIGLVRTLPSGADKSLKILMTIAFVILLVSSLPIASQKLANFYEREAYPKIDAATPQAQTIVLLGHNTTEASLPFKDIVQLSENGDRILYAALLYKLQNQKPKLVVSAGQRDYLEGDQKNRLEALDISNILEGLGVNGNDVRLESESRDIRSSAVKVKKLLEAEKVSDQPLILVTSGIQMRRALLTYKKLDLNVIPAATDFHSFPGNELLKERLSVDDFLPNVEALSLTTKVIEDFFGFIYYFVRGWIAISL